MSRPWALLVWGLLGIGLLAGQIAAVLSKGRIPTLGALVRRSTENPIGQWLLVLAWMWLGWHAFAR
ncbi:MAG: DUF6186 family protein [Acidimicrobiales bacterium]